MASPRTPPIDPGRGEQSASVLTELVLTLASSRGLGMDGSECALAEAPGFRAEVNRNGNNSATVRLVGELDIASAGAARRALEQLDVGIQQIVLDLSHITFCDAAGVRFLLMTQEQAHTTGRHLVVRNASRPVRRVLALTGDLSGICPADPPADEKHCATSYLEAIVDETAPPARTHRAAKLVERALHGIAQ